MAALFAGAAVARPANWRAAILCAAATTEQLLWRPRPTNGVPARADLVIQFFRLGASDCARLACKQSRSSPPAPGTLAKASRGCPAERSLEEAAV